MTVAEGKVFGQSVPRLEDLPLLRGEARFVDDITLPGTLHAAFVRSPHAHARIAGIDKSAALDMPGVVAIFVLDDIRGDLSDHLIRTALPSPSFQESRHRPALADGEVLYVGEPVAMVIADDRYVAEDAAALVFVDYDPLPAAGDCRDALADDAPRYHSAAAHNIAARFKTDFGDIESQFAKAAHVVKETCSIHRGVAHSMECRGVVAAVDPIEDRLTIWSSTQTPHVAKRLVCELLGRDDDKVRVVTPDIGGGFGPKLVFYSEELVVALAAVRIGRPVKWIEDRREHFISTTQERDEIWEMEVAIDSEARILGLRGKLIHDNGAYMVRGVNVALGAASTLTLPYVVPALDLDTIVVATNKVPVTPIRGAGKPQGVFVMERLIDRAAEAAGIDRAEIRRRNIVPRESIPYATPMKTRGGMPITLDAGDYPACLDKALRSIGWMQFAERQAHERANGRYIGLGLANYVEGTGRGPYEPVTVKVGENGRIHVACGASAIGQGTKTMLAQIVAEQLGADMSNITVVTGDTSATDLGLGTFNSRHTAIAGPSAHAAAVKIRNKALRVAAHLLAVGEQALEIEGRHVKLRGSDDRKLSLGEIARAVAGLPGYYLPGVDEPGLSTTETVIINDMAYSNGSAAVEVEVDIETGIVTVERVVMAHDCGTVVNPRLVAGQIWGGLAHGLGNALYERMAFDADAQPVSTNLAEYLLIGPSEMPRSIELVESPTRTPLNELGVKGVGETGVLPMAAAVASAIEDALSPFGVHINSVPVMPHEILAKIRQGAAA
ncbi:MAG: xanthine dehydrogenase family protein molybdopterin-binding subunit [Hyphomicrobiaceae bacterium]